MATIETNTSPTITPEDLPLAPSAPQPAKSVAVARPPRPTAGARSATPTGDEFGGRK
jgi:hypothetical protein